MDFIIKHYKEAVILLNMGGPKDVGEVETFLKNMFNDFNILSIKNALIRKLVSKMIVRKIVHNVKKHYSFIGGKSPIIEYTEKLVAKLQSMDKSRLYTYAMNYTPPFAKDIIKKLKENNIENITLFSMYPQYSTTTTKSSIESVMKAIKKLKYNPKIKTVKRYYNDELYNKSVIESIKETLKDKNEKEYVLILSAHSVPKTVIEKGDTYQKECEDNLEILKNYLEKEGIIFKNIVLSYQSKIGPHKWLEPSTLETIELYKNDKIIIYPIAFTVDNSETAYELEIEYKNIALNEKKIKDFLICKCANDRESFAKSIIKLIENTL